MALIGNTYGKGRVRVMRVHRDGDSLRGAPSFRSLLMVEGDFARIYTDADNSKCPVHRYDEEPRQHRCA